MNMAEQLNEIELLQIEKDKVIEKSRARLDELVQQIIVKEKVIADLDQTFKEEYDRRLKVMEDKEELFKQRELMIDELTRNYEKAVAQFEEDKKKFYLNQDDIQAKTQKLIEQNNAILADIATNKANIEELILKHTNIYEEATKAESRAKQAQDDSQAQYDALVEKISDIENKKKELDSIKENIDTAIKTSRSAKADLLIKEGDIRDLIAVRKELLDKVAQEMMELEAKRVSTNAEVKKLADTIQQISAEREKNTRDAIANRAKEITLNEKERSLGERERNIKIIEQSKG
jgi:chromosome segregation ATPase